NVMVSIFFFQAEDGIRDRNVTGVQTCALPILVDLKGVFKAYNKKMVIEDVNLSIQKGKITSFIGPNGAGKSTLISMVSRLIAKDEGIITIDGEDLSKSKDEELAKKISIL